MPKVSHPSAHLPDIHPFSRALIMWYQSICGWNLFLAPITNTHWASLPLFSTSITPERAAESAREGSFAPKAPQGQHICQETWCQYLPGALQSHNSTSWAKLPSPSFLPPPFTWLQSGEGAAANTGNKSGFKPLFLLVEKEKLQLYICIHTYTHIYWIPNISFSLHFPLNTLYWGWKKKN